MASQELINAQKQLEAYRKRDGVKASVSVSVSSAIAPASPPAATQSPITAVTPQPFPTIPEHVKAYPSLLVAANKAQLAPVARVYLLLRAMDASGKNCGWLPIDQVNQLADKMTPWYTMGSRNLRGLIGQGDGIFWTYEKKYKRVRMLGAATIAQNLGVEHLTGKPVQLPIDHLLGGIQEVRAAFLAAWHAGRKDNDPVSRMAIANATGAKPSSQRTYDKITDTKSRIHYILFEIGSIDANEIIWKYGRTPFTYTDWAGKVGRKGKQYLAITKSNSYAPNLAQAAKGRQRKVNKQLNRVDNVERGAELRVNKINYPDAVSASKALNRDSSHDKYYLLATSLTPTATTKPHLMTVGLWGVLQAQA